SKGPKESETEVDIADVAAMVSNQTGMGPRGPFWQTDEEGFTDHGGPVWGSDPNNPIIGFRDGSAFERDHFWKGLSLARGIESDHGALGATPRYGQLFRSFNFTLTKGRVFIRVKGRGKLYAAVDSHTLIAGPLHGKLIRDFDTSGRWQTVSFDLAAYNGHR